MRARMPRLRPSQKKGSLWQLFVGGRTLSGQVGPDRQSLADRIGQGDATRSGTRIAGRTATGQPA